MMKVSMVVILGLLNVVLSFDTGFQGQLGQ